VLLVPIRCSAQEQAALAIAALQPHHRAGEFACPRCPRTFSMGYVDFGLRRGRLDGPQPTARYAAFCNHINNSSGSPSVHSRSQNTLASIECVALRYLACSASSRCIAFSDPLRDSSQSSDTVAARRLANLCAAGSLPWTTSERTRCASPLLRAILQCVEHRCTLSDPRRGYRCEMVCWAIGCGEHSISWQMKG
jgi:hypothetical protein